LVGKPKRKRALGRPKRKRRKILKCIFKEWGGVPALHWSGSRQRLTSSELL